MQCVINRKAFTLVELAIVMTIIGLLIGGVLKGQELLENARVTSTIAQVKSYDAAITAFRDIYAGLPGDLLNAGERIPGCNANCTPFSNPATGYGAGDGVIGLNSSYCVGVGRAFTVNPPNHAEDESWLMWVHLLKANLITGVTDVGITQAGNRSFGGTDPASKIGGGFWPGTNMCGAMSQTKGLSLVFDTGFNDIENVSGGAVAGTGVMTPARASQLDRKMDDGLPRTGNVQALGNASGYCDASTNEYANRVTNGQEVNTKDCSLLISLQK